MSRSINLQSSWTQPCLPARWADILDEDEDSSSEAMREGWGKASSSTAAKASVCPRPNAAGNSDDDCSTEAPSESGETSPYEDGSPRILAARPSAVWHQESKGSMSPGRFNTGRPRDHEYFSPTSYQSKAGDKSRYQNKSQASSSWEHRDTKAKQQRDNGAKSKGYRSEMRWPTEEKPVAARVQQSRKPQCQFIIGIEEDRAFGVVRRVLGLHGKHVKSIAEQSGAKLRLRGAGSGFKEGPECKESTDPLMLCVSAQDSYSYEVAKRLLRGHLEDVYRQYREYLDEMGWWSRSAKVKINLHEGPREGHF